MYGCLLPLSYGQITTLQRLFFIELPQVHKILTDPKQTNKCPDEQKQPQKDCHIGKSVPLSTILSRLDLRS